MGAGTAKTSDGKIIKFDRSSEKNLLKRIAYLPPAEQDAIHSKFITYREKVAYKGAGALKKNIKNRALVKKEIDPIHIETIINMLGRLYQTQEIIRIMKEEYKIRLNSNIITEIYDNNLPVVEKLRNEFRDNVHSVRLYNKRSRLEELSEMFEKLKIDYDEKKSPAVYRNMLATLQTIRMETEADTSTTVNNSVNIQINSNIQDQIQSESIKTLPIKEILLGRISARMNKSPEKLIANLHNSYYNDFFEKNDTNFSYPSQSNYSILDMKRKEEEPEVVEEVKEEVRPTINIKDLLLKKLKEKKDDTTT